MYFSSQVIFQSVLAILVLVGTTSCTQDPMIRINSTSSVKLVPNKEIRYKSCGESSDGCQTIFQNINSEKIKSRDISRTRYIQYMSQQNKATIEANKKISGSLPIVGYASPMTAVYSEKSLADDAERQGQFEPTEEEIKKIIREVSIINLNEHTFSKSDGSIVVICPTRYCAIASADGGWIGIGEQSKPNQLGSLISN
jgi:uncharacterized protein YraI